MSETLNVPKEAGKEARYAALLPQLALLMDNKLDLVANMAGMTAALKTMFGFFWVGFYRVVGDELVVGPYQGSLACTRIRYGKGVCGTAWKRAQTIVVPDVDQFEGHISCSSLSRSEIVVPVFKEGAVVAVLDIDSDQLAAFDDIDAAYLEQCCRLLA
ncbi:MAG TPA: diguanylate cyclase [Bacteroidales bacterium]|nr:diguanylate cyclase [Bacteroidales bacterium]